jgi:hypothetical protein
MELKSAWEIALERNQKYEELSSITSELLDHVALLEECWDSIHPSDDDGRISPRQLERAA